MGKFSFISAGYSDKKMKIQPHFAIYTQPFEVSLQSHFTTPFGRSAY